MRSLNKVMMIGNAGKKPELKITAGGIAVATFRLVTTEIWRDKDGTYQEQADWHTVVAWRGLAEISLKIINKGSRLYVEGKLQNRICDDSRFPGGKRLTPEIVADNIILLDGRRETKEEDGAHEETACLQAELTDGAGDFSSLVEDDPLF